MVHPLTGENRRPRRVRALTQVARGLVAAVVAGVLALAPGVVDPADDEPAFDLQTAGEPDLPTATTDARSHPGRELDATLLPAVTGHRDRPALLALPAADGDRGDDGHSGELGRRQSWRELIARFGTAPAPPDSWPEPTIEPEDRWVDAGHGVAVPDVLLRIRFCESTNDYRAAHPVSSARGAYQFLTGSWQWYGHADRYGVAGADLATPAQQDEAAVITLRRSGTKPWLASRWCWADPGLSPSYATTDPPVPTTSTTAVPTSDVGPTSAPSSTVDTTPSTSPDEIVPVPPSDSTVPTTSDPATTSVTGPSEPGPGSSTTAGPGTTTGGATAQSIGPMSQSSNPAAGDGG